MHRVGGPISTTLLNSILLPFPFFPLQILPFQASLTPPLLLLFPHSSSPSSLSLDCALLRPPQFRCCRRLDVPTHHPPATHPRPPRYRYRRQIQLLRYGYRDRRDEHTHTHSDLLPTAPTRSLQPSRTGVLGSYLGYQPTAQLACFACLISFPLPSPLFLPFLSYILSCLPTTHRAQQNSSPCGYVRLAVC